MPAFPGRKDLTDLLRMTLGQAKSNWNPDLEAAAIVSYFRKRFSATTKKAA
jgi:hypothetical protein